MKKYDKKKQEIMMHLSVVPLASGYQLQSVFNEYSHPAKRVSDCLSQLEKEGFIEGTARPIGKSKVWRLSRKGRIWMDVRTPSVLLSTRNIEHYLAIADVYFTLQVSDALGTFICEPRFPFTDDKGNRQVYAPDGFFSWQDNPHFLEVQRTPISRSNWREKWKRGEAFFESEAPLTVERHTVTDKTPIVVLSKQPDETIADTSLSLLICTDITRLFPTTKSEPQKKPTLSMLLSELTKDIGLSRSYHEQENPSGHAPFSLDTLLKYEKWVKEMTSAKKSPLHPRE